MFRRVHYHELDSTQDEASRRVVAGELATAEARPLLVTADRQTAGRGRRDRPWQSPAGGLWMSLAVPLNRPSDAYGPLPLVAGLAAATTVERLIGVRALIKWPNDLLVGGRKLAGLLCTLEPAAPRPVAIVGIGVNANFPAALLGDDLRLPPTGLLDLTGKWTDLSSMSHALADAVLRAIGRYEAEGFAADRGAIESRLACRGEPVAVEPTSGARLEGRLVGLCPAGRLVLTTPDGERSVDIGDVTRLTPAPASADRVHAEDLEFSR